MGGSTSQNTADVKKGFVPVCLATISGSIAKPMERMNPIEQIWKEIRKQGFYNEVFASLEKVVERLCNTICSLSNQIISSITG